MVHRFFYCSISILYISITLYIFSLLLINKKKEIKRNKVYIGDFPNFGVKCSLGTLSGRQPQAGGGNKPRCKCRLVSGFIFG